MPERISIFFYIDIDGCHVARALEMSLAGGGSSWAEAIIKLAEAVQAQFELAEERGSYDFTWIRARQEFFDRFDQSSSMVWKDDTLIPGATIEARIDNKALAIDTDHGLVVPYLLNFLSEDSYAARNDASDRTTTRRTKPTFTKEDVGFSPSTVTQDALLKVRNAFNQSSMATNAAGRHIHAHPSGT